MRCRVMQSEIDETSITCYHCTLERVDCTWTGSLLQWFPTSASNSLGKLSNPRRGGIPFSLDRKCGRFGAADLMCVHIQCEMASEWKIFGHHPNWFSQSLLDWVALFVNILNKSHAVSKGIFTCADVSAAFEKASQRSIQRRINLSPFTKGCRGPGV